MCPHLCLKVVGLEKLLIFNVNGVLCYFPHCVVLQGNAQVFGKNIDTMKMKVITTVEHFLSMTFKNF